MAQTGMPPLDLIRRTSAASSCAFSARAAVRSSSGRRHERGRAVLGRADRPGWPGGRPRTRLRQPRHLPDRARSALPPGVPRHHRRQQHGVPQRGHDHRIPGRTRLGPGHRLGQPRRPGPHPPAGPL